MHVIATVFWGSCEVVTQNGMCGIFQDLISTVKQGYMTTRTFLTLVPCTQETSVLSVPPTDAGVKPQTGTSTGMHHS